MKKKSSLRVQILFILLVFIMLVLGLIYFFQTSLLDDFYKQNKIKSMERIAENISNNLTSDNLKSVLSNQSLSNEVCVRIASNSINVVGYMENSACALGQINDIQIRRLANEVIKNGGKKVFENVSFEMFPGNKQDIFVYGLVKEINNEKALVLVSSSVLPLDVTVNTIKDQYFGIVFIVLVATILLALAISKLVLKPVKQIEKESKNLAQGEYDKSRVKAASEELNELNETLGLANEEIVKADKAKRELIGNVSHDLRTPLTMIVGYGEMIRDIKEENNEENINTIIDEAKRLSTLVDDLLDISKIQGGNIELDIKECSLNEILKDVYKQYSKYCKNNKIKFVLQTIEDKKVNVDERRLKQVLYNFINNAINYNDKQEKQIILGVEMHEDKYRVYVYDNGQGISKDDLKNVWDRYYKVDKKHKRANLGSGIGLSLSKELLEAHKLKYGVESSVNEYSKFYFDI